MDQFMQASSAINQIFDNASYDPSKQNPIYVDDQYLDDLATVLLQNEELSENLAAVVSSLL